MISRDRPYFVFICGTLISLHTVIRNRGPDIVVWSREAAVIGSHVEISLPTSGR